MKFRVLGSLAAISDGSAAALGPPKQRALLALLLMHVGEVVPIDRLVSMLWGDDAPRTAAHSIQIYISDLRKAFEPMGGGGLIVTRPPGYGIEADRDSIDAWQFRRLVQDGARMLDAGERERGRESLRRAMTLWRGPALSDFTYEEFAQPHIRRLTDLYLDALEVLAGAELDAGRTADALELLTTAVREDPLRERSRELLMLALYRAGRHAEALRTFAQLQGVLDEELGIEPSPGLRSLYDRILLHDPTLLPEPREPSSATARNPYKGLRSFNEQDAADFFGRDRLVDRLLAALAAGARLVSLVGPSGAGKSSVMAAGLLPRIREGGLPGSADWQISWMVPAADPLQQLEQEIQAGTDLLVIDQFEQVFAATPEGGRDSFLQALADAVAGEDGVLRVVLDLRADYYDRPLLSPAFAAIFTPSVINVIPMAANELEAAIVGPARQVGVAVDPALLAELVGDIADRPGSLPLLQYAMTELFERRQDATLTRAAFAGLGGLRGLLTREAEGLYGGLDDAAKAAAMQVFLRLVRTGGGVAESRRRVPLGELTDLPIDPVALSDVLTTFGRRRLLTFDREPGSDQATVEVAHEALLVEWERLAAWIDRHRVDLKRHEALVLGAEEWDQSGRNPDYLFSGTRLREYESWLAGGIIQLSRRERAFVEAGVESRRSGEAEAVAAAETHRRLQRRARSRLVGLGAVVALLAGLVTYAVLVGIGASSRRVVLAGWDDAGSFSKIVSSGFDRGTTDFGFLATKTWAGKWFDPEAGTFDEEGYADELAPIFSEAPALFVMMDLPIDAADALAREHPDQHFAVVDQVGAESNVAYLSFAEEQGAYLAGVAAALTTKTGTIGFIGGLDFPVIWRFEAGYEAGARAVDEDIEIRSTYLSADAEVAFGIPDRAEATARAMYLRGADVIFQAAGDSGAGVFEAAASMSAELDRQFWAIGADTDQYMTAPLLPGAVRAAAWRPHILTSVVKDQDQAVYLALEDVAQDRFVSGPTGYGLASGLLHLSYTGGFINDIKPMIEGYRQSIIDGAIEVPCVPDDRHEQARKLGISPEDCGGR